MKRYGLDHNPYITQLKSLETPYITQQGAYFTQQNPYITQLFPYFTHTSLHANPCHVRVTATFKTLNLLNLLKLIKTRSTRATRFALARRPEFFFLS